MSRIHIKGLNAYEYQHHFDRKALALLKNTQGLTGVMKKISEFGIETFTRIQLTGSGLRVTAANFKPIHDLLTEACEILDIEKIPELYLLRGEVSPVTIGVERPIVAIPSSFIDQFNDDELMFILGHQLSYIKSESLLYQQVASSLNLMAEAGIGGLVNLITIPVKIAIMRWEKMSHYTADRAGLLCCQDTEAAVSTFVKMAGQPEKYAHQIDVDEFRKQAFEFAEFDLDKYNKIIKLLLSLDDTHPPYVIRAAEFFKWIKTGDFEKILQRKPTAHSLPKPKCTFCGQPTIGDEKFCTHCGNKIKEEKISCKHCGNEMDEKAKFCSGCGKAAEEASDK